MPPCRICRDLDQANEFQEDHNLRHVRELRRSAQDGCNGCNLLLSSITALSRGMDPGILDGRGFLVDLRYKPRGSPSDFKRLVVDFWDEAPPPAPRKIELWTPTVESCPWSAIPYGNKTSGNTGSEESLRFIQQWMTTCNLNHKTCTPVSEGFFPTRVLDIGSSKDDIKLIETNNDEGIYVCLSYCWGMAKFISTTSETLEERKSGIPWACLPKTFQHAILITRKIGARYLWIDSLCIIQNSLADWAKESAVMADIYEKSFLTIAAAFASNPDEGLFFELTHPDYEMKYATSDGKSGTVLARVSRDHELSDHDALPLYNRGWVYQERLLARRTLHCCRLELCYECIEDFQCECGHIRVDIGGVETEKKAASMSYANARTAWHQIVEKYTKLSLSYPSDMLPALSGLTKKMATLRSGKYLAGLWEDTIQADLLWASTWAGKRSEKWRTPSWSWASMDTEIYFLPRNRKNAEAGYSPTWELLASEVEIPTPNIYGAVSAASLTISGFLVPAVLRYKMPEFGEIDMWMENVSMEPGQNSMLHRKNAEAKADRIKRGEPDTYQIEIAGSTYHINEDYKMYFPGPGQVLDRHTVYVFEAAKNVKEGKVILLILRMVDENGPKMERIGVIETFEDPLRGIRRSSIHDLFAIDLVEQDEESNEGIESRISSENYALREPFEEGSYSEGDALDEERIFAVRKDIDEEISPRGDVSNREKRDKEDWYSCEDNSDKEVLVVENNDALPKHSFDSFSSDSGGEFNRMKEIFGPGLETVQKWFDGAEKTIFIFV